MSLQARHDADIDDFCKYENQREPPSLSDRGKLRQDTKSGIIGCLPGIPAHGHSALVRNATVVLDMAAVIHIIKPQRASIFGEYTHMQLMPCSQSQMTENTSTVDAVKRQVSSHRHVPSGVRLQIAEHECLPKYPSQSSAINRWFTLQAPHNKCWTCTQQYTNWYDSLVSMPARRSRHTDDAPSLLCCWTGSI